jgi:hypothetical protein
MASSIAQRRALRDARRKKLLGGRRALEPVSLADKVRVAAEWKLHTCALHGDIAGGICTVYLARQSPVGPLALAAFLVDSFALGIKDVVFDLTEPSEFGEFLEMAGGEVTLTPIEPSYGRKLVREAAAYGASLGLKPPRNFRSVELMFGDVRAEDCREEFHFGCEGRPCYVLGGLETTRQVGRWIERLTDTLGPDGFDIVMPQLDDPSLAEKGTATPALLDAAG